MAVMKEHVTLSIVWLTDVFVIVFGSTVELYGTEEEDLSGFDTHNTLVDTFSVAFGLLMGLVNFYY